MRLVERQETFSYDRFNVWARRYANDGRYSAIYNVLKDDDEDDFESVLRKSVTEVPYQGLANEL